MLLKLHKQGTSTGSSVFEEIAGKQYHSAPPFRSDDADEMFV